MKKILKTSALCTAISLMAIAATGSKAFGETAEKEEGDPKPAFYILKEGDKAMSPSPLPDLTRILINWTYSDNSKTSQEGFRGWDIDHDGRFDMLEVLDASGKTLSWAYDFDGDGAVDALESSQAEQTFGISLEPESLLDSK